MTFFQMLIVKNAIQANGLVSDLYSRNVTKTNLTLKLTFEESKET